METQGFRMNSCTLYADDYDSSNAGCCSVQVWTNNGPGKPVGVLDMRFASNYDGEAAYRALGGVFEETAWDEQCGWGGEYQRTQVTPTMEVTLVALMPSDLSVLE